MSNDILIRPAKVGDLPALGRLGARLVDAHHGFDSARFMRPPGDVAEGYGWFLGTQLREPDVVLLVASRGEQVVGYVYAALEPQSWKELRDAAGFIHDVVVDPPFEGQGLAGRLIEEAMAWLKARGAPRVVLWTASQNTAAHRLFARLGFRTTMLEMTRELGDA